MQNCDCCAFLLVVARFVRDDVQVWGGDSDVLHHVFRFEVCEFLVVQRVDGVAHPELGAAEVEPLGLC